MRSTKTATREARLYWQRTAGAHAGVVAEYGPFTFKVYAWQRGSYLATVHNHETGERVFCAGNSQREIPTQAKGKELCEVVFRRLRDEDLRKGITRGGGR